MYTSYADLVSFDPETGIAKFDYFDMLRGDKAVAFLVASEGYTQAAAEELVENFADVAQAMGFGLLPLGEVREEEVEYDPGSVTDLGNEARRILGLLEGGEKSFDELAAASLLEAGLMSSILMQLELKMLIRRSADQLYGRR